jgi:hypothetical protein
MAFSEVMFVPNFVKIYVLGQTLKDKDSQAGLQCKLTISMTGAKVS